MDKTEQQYVAITQRASLVSDLGAVAITIAIIAASATSMSRFLLALALNVGLMVFNIAYSHFVVPTRGSRADLVRMTINGIVATIAYTLIDWPLPVWFWLPFVAIMIDQAAGGRRALLIVLALCGIQDIGALAAGEAWLEPAVFTGFAVICWAMSGARVHIIREMLVGAEQQRDELSRAHDQLVAEVAARERAELELRQAQKLESLGRLASGIAHEINTPMQFIANSVQFVREGVTDLMSTDANVDRAYLAEEVPKALLLASEGCQRVATIVRSMQQFAHPDGALAAVDLNSAIECTLTVAMHEYKRVADVGCDFAALPLVTCNGGEINQVLLNLITNAADAIENRIGASGKRGTIRLSTHSDERGIVIAVADDGTGIPETVRERIFDPFFTTKSVGRGTGQGLSISRTLIERNGGKLTFETELGRGTTFYITLPAADSLAA